MFQNSKLRPLMKRIRKPQTTIFEYIMQKESVEYLIRTRAKVKQRDNFRTIASRLNTKKVMSITHYYSPGAVSRLIRLPIRRIVYNISDTGSWDMENCDYKKDRARHLDMTLWSSGRHLASGSEGCRFESWLAGLMLSPWKRLFTCIHSPYSCVK